MHRSLSGPLAFVALVVSVAGCGPSPDAVDPPPAEPGTASLRFDMEPVVSFDAPVVCENGVTAERSSSPTSIYCSVAAPDGSAISVLLELGSAASDPDGTELSTQSDITLVRAGATSTGRASSVAADTASWNGTVTLRLGPEGSPRTAVLDGALSSVTSTPIAMTFRAVSVTLDLD